MVSVISYLEDQNNTDKTYNGDKVQFDFDIN